MALAKEAYIRGADLTLVVANVSVEIPSVFNVIHVETSREMNEVILSLVPDFDIFISTAAVSDFEFNEKYDKKIDSESSLFLNLKVRFLNSRVCFKAEYLYVLCVLVA